MLSRPVVKPTLILTILSLTALVRPGFVLPGPPDRAAPSRTITPRIELRTVHSLFFSYGPGRTNCGGGSRPIIVRVSKSDVGDLRVGFFESQFLGLQPSWRAAGWMAVVVAGLVTGRPMTSWRIAFDAAGKINGPSAGGLVTAAVLSAVRGQKLLPGVTMTGTINPDGSIGPVGGIYYKLLGAKRAGMTKVLIPAGITRQRACHLGFQDLIARGRALGLQVVKVADVQAAYRHLTGKLLPRPRDKGQKFALPAAAQKAAIKAYDGWSRTFDTWLNRMKAANEKLKPKLSPPVARLWRVALARRAEAREAFRKKNLPAALSLMWSAAVLADLGTHISLLEFLGRTKGLKGMAAAFRGFLTPGAFFRKFEARLKARPVRNLNDLITVADAYLFFNAARGLSQTTWMMHRKLKRAGTRNFALRLIIDGTKYAVLARNLVALMDSLLEIGLGHPGPALPPESKLTAWAKMMYRAAQANLGYIEAAIFGPAARRRGGSARRLKGWWLDRDLHYLTALRCFASVRAMMKSGAAGLHSAAAVLGGAVGSWALSALVVAKHDSLWVKVDRAGRIKKLGNPAGLERLLLSGRNRLRAGLIRARAAGFSPVMPIFHLKVAEYSARSEAALSDRLSALSEYWLGSIWGQLFIVLGR